MTNIEKAVDLLKNSEFTLVAVSNEETLTSNERGVKPLLQLLDAHTDLSEYSAADKVIGKAAAFLYVLLGAKEIYTGVISKSALDVLERADIKISYDKLVPAIRNRTDTGFCPMETSVKDTDDPDTALLLIRKKLTELSK